MPAAKNSNLGAMDEGIRRMPLLRPELSRSFGAHPETIGAPASGPVSFPVPGTILSMGTLLIRGGRIVDPARLDATGDLQIVDGRITMIETGGRLPVERRHRSRGLHRQSRTARHPCAARSPSRAAPRRPSHPARRRPSRAASPSRLHAQHPAGPGSSRMDRVRRRRARSADHPGLRHRLRNRGRRGRTTPIGTDLRRRVGISDDDSIETTPCSRCWNRSTPRAPASCSTVGFRP